MKGYIFLIVAVLVVLLGGWGLYIYDQKKTEEKKAFFKRECSLLSKEMRNPIGDETEGKLQGQLKRTRDCLNFMRTGELPK